MTTIYLIRHAEAEGNLYRVAQGQHESNLTDRGWRQVRALERRFADVPVDAVYASDLYRTRATATAIYRPKNLPLHRCPGLREICVGDWEGRTWGDIARGTPQAMADFGSRMDRWAIPGAETPAQVLERVRRTVEDIARENPGRTLALFSHGYAIRLLLANLQGISLRDTGARSPTGDNTAVSLLEWDGEGLRVVFANDNSHLKTPEYLAGEKPARPKRAFALEPGLWFRPLGRGEARERLAAWAEASPFPEAPLTLEGFLEEEVRCGYTVSAEMKKLWAVELDLLAEFDRVCKKHGLTYFAFGGTLLGAVRHQGFIPWDDDIDVVMFREDYRRLTQIAAEEFRHPYFFQTPFTDCGLVMGGSRLRNSNTTVSTLRPSPNTRLIAVADCTCPSLAELL